MLFHYILSGWEGSAHNIKILQDTINNREFTIPKSKYYLADAEYSNYNFLLISYVRVRYHLKKQKNTDLKPENKKELFNLRHSQLRNIVERIFNILKRRFLSINSGAEFDISTQIQTQFDLTALHNFIVLHRQTNDENIYIAEAPSSNKAGDTEPLKNTFSTNTRINKFRDDIAAAI